MKWKNQPDGDGLYVWHTKPGGLFIDKGLAYVEKEKVLFLGDGTINIECHAVADCAPRLWFKLPELPK